MQDLFSATENKTVSNPIHTDVDDSGSRIMRLTLRKTVTSANLFKIEFAMGETDGSPLIGGLVQNLNTSHALWFTSSLANLMHGIYWTRFVTRKYHRMDASWNFVRKSIEKMFIDGAFNLQKHAPARPPGTPSTPKGEIRGSAVVFTVVP